MSAKKSKDQKAFQRGTSEFNHHLFKLLPAPMIKESGFNSEPQNKILIPMEHCHMFHTIDSRGRIQHKSSAIGGHFHEVTVEYSDDPELAPKVKVGPAKREVAVRQGKRLIKKTVPLQVGTKVDDHTHEVEYHGFDVIKARKMNSEFMKFQSKVEQRKPSHPEIK